MQYEEGTDVEITGYPWTVTTHHWTDFEMPVNHAHCQRFNE
jgi:hypothetical protein